MLPWRCSTAAASSARSSGTIRLRMRGRRWRRWGRRGLLPPWRCSRASCTLLAGKTMMRRRTEISASSDAVGPLLLPRAMFCAAVESAASARDDATAATSTPVKRGSARGRLTPATRHAYGRSPTCWLRPLPALVSPRHAVRRRRVALRCERGTAEESSCRDRRHWGQAPLFLLCGWEKERRVANTCLPSPPAAIRPRARSTTPHTPSHIPEP